MNDQRIKSFFRRTRPIWGPVFLLLLILLAYGNSFRGAFVFDDITEVLEAGPVRSDEGTVRWPVAHPTRTVVDLTFLLNRRWGGDSPVGYHAVNLALHGWVALLLLGLLRRILLRRGPFCGAPDAAGLGALIVTALWAVHPIQTQAVTYIVQRHEILASLFYLGTVYAYIRVREGIHPVFWRGICLGSAILGMASKEIMVTAPLALLAYEGLVLQTSWRQFRQQVALFWVLLALTPLITVGLMGMAIKMVSLPGGVLSVTATPWQYALTQTGVWAHYLKLMIWPWPLCLDYGWPIARGMTDVVLPLSAGLVALGGTVYGVFHRRAWAFGPVMFGLILLPTSSFLPLPDAAMEHRMYLPSAVVMTGLICGAGWVWRRLMTSPGRWLTTMGVLVLGLGVGVGIVLTRERNRDYIDPIRLWRGALEVNPENPRAWFHLARACRDAGRVEKARRAVAGLLAMVPDYATMDPADLAEQARIDFEKRRSIRYYALANTFLGVLELDQNRPDVALIYLHQAVRVHPDPSSLYNLAQAHYRVGDWDAARGVCERVLRVEPDNIEGWRLASRIAREQGDEFGMALALEKVLRLLPGDRQARYDLARLWVTAKEPALRRPADALRVARELWDESRGQSPKVRELMEMAQGASPPD